MRQQIRCLATFRRGAQHASEQNTKSDMSVDAGYRSLPDPRLGRSFGDYQFCVAITDLARQLSVISSLISTTAHGVPGTALNRRTAQLSRAPGMTGNCRCSNT